MKDKLQTHGFRDEPDGISSLFARKKTIPLVNVAHLPTTADMGSEGADLRRTVARDMEEGVVYSIGRRFNGELTDRADHRYNGGNIDVLPGASLE